MMKPRISRVRFIFAACMGAALGSCSSDASPSASIDAPAAMTDAPAAMTDAPAAAADASTMTVDVVTISTGMVSGQRTATMRSFKGIPYATPPVGPLRWKAPTAAASFTGVRDATVLAPHCPQNVTPFGQTSTGEDCLYLNVYAPTTEGPHPVMFWIHGGAFLVGESDEYDATRLVAEGVVVVTINYRLGQLGFMAHPALSAEQDGSSGNYGLMDQQLALHWVQDEIAKFGGDKNNVTIFGESAGGLSVHLQMVMNGAAGLFHKAIVESGAYGNALQPSLQAAETAGAAFATSAGCTDPCRVDKLRALTETAILSAQGAQANLIPPVDTKVVPMGVKAAFTAGNYQQVPVIEGTNHDEWRLFVAITELTSGNPPLTADGYPAAVTATLGTSVLTSTLTGDDFYPLTAYDSPSLALSTLGTDFIFACNGRTAANLLSGNTAATYEYEFNDPTAPQLFIPQAAVSFPEGANHAAELQYLWILPGSTLTTDQQALATTMVKYWTQFAKAGDPNGTGVPAWPAYTAAADMIQKLAPGGSGVAPITTFAADHKCAQLAPFIP